MLLNGELKYCYYQANALYTHIQNLHEALIYTYQQPAMIRIIATKITETTVPTMYPMVSLPSDRTAVVTKEKKIRSHSR